MSIKRKWVGIFVIILVMILASCSQMTDNGPQEGEFGNLVTLSEQAPSRKIIYKATLSVYTDILSNAVTDVKSLLTAEDWVDSEQINETRAILVLRIKTQRLDSVLDAIRQEYEVSSFEKTATDISLNYFDKTTQVLTYQAEQTRLLELYESATLSEMISINTRLSQLEVLISKLQGELNVFDSLVDYSEVHITIYGSKAAAQAPFGKSIVYSFLLGFNALISFFRVIILAFVALLPWAVVITPTVFLVIYLTKRSRKKKIKSKEVQ
ncbi:MAG: DUF4349 domain-containing protein [Candidatus Izemoplasmatales bacterium]|nr:DUF4349 domain-containing protein [bacterium]MDZ4196755.1 DUF4349 domain-containing protein [Candidatus Izemoplasmatales bacterium]